MDPHTTKAVYTPTKEKPSPGRAVGMSRDAPWSVRNSPCPWTSSTPPTPGPRSLPSRSSGCAGGPNATQNILVNPGGPGGPGAEFLFRRGEQLRTIVGEGFHLLAFDPRGMGASTPRARCYPDKATALALGRVRDRRTVEDSPEAYAFGRNFAQACADTMGEHGLYLNTPQTAADMNTILDAVGQTEMVYWGFSYGTLLGQTYAALFPRRAHRMVLDAVVNQFDWYEELSNAEDYVDTERVLDAFFDECLQAGPTDCPLAAHATSKDELFDKVVGLAESLYVEPMSVYVNKTAWGTLDYFDIMFSAIFPALYKPPNWYSLADRLAQLLEGNATEAFLHYGAGQNPWGMYLDGAYFITMNDGKSGPNFWPQDRRTALETIIAPAVNYSRFAASTGGRYYIQQHWTIPKTHTYQPRRGVATAHPLLLTSTTYDPICPLVSARSAQQAFAGARLVEVQGYGHGAIAVPSLCVARHIRGYLYHGTLPEGRHTLCEVDGHPYFVKPAAEEGGVGGGALREFEDAEDLRVHLAQLELGRDAEWPVWSRW